MSMYPRGPYGYPVQDAGAPYGRDPFTGQPLSDKQKLVAGLLQIFLGTLGVGRFYSGHTSIAVTPLVLAVVGSSPRSCSWVRAHLRRRGVDVLDGVLLIATDSTDSRGLKLR